jgi:hypothetical protein
MPNAINPNDYNIEYFSSGFLGVTTVDDFREYLFSKNLPDLPPELVSSPTGSFTGVYAQRGVEKSINYGPITNPGDLDEWLLEGNVPVNLNSIRDNVIFKDNEYGPSSYQAYNCPDAVPEETGFIQYPISSGGDDYKQILLNDQLGLGPGTAINFESELNTIAKERRKEEVLNKLKLKAEDLAGKINLDPIGLLSGQNLVLKDYEITARPSTIGKIFDFALDTAGFTIPTSPIPKGAFGSWGDDDGPTTYKSIMDSTGKGTKSLIFNSVARNKYGPILQDPSGKLANTFGAGQAPQPKKYTDNVDDEFAENVRANNEKPLVDKINQAVGKVIDNIAGNAGIGKADNDVSPYEFEKPSSTTDSIIKNSEYGFDDLPNNPKDTWDLAGPRATTTTTTTTTIPGEFGLIPDINAPLGSEGSLTLGQITPDTILEKTVYESDKGAIGTSAPFDLTTELGFFSLDYGMFWGASQEDNNPFKRGLLKYTQDLVNNTTNDKTSKSRFIGVTNDDTNFDPNTRKHKNYSMGNTVSSDGTYCRSWSVRNPYRTVSDLIRHGANQGQDSLTRPEFNLSVLDTNGFVKVAPYVTDVSGGVDENDKTVKLNLGNPAVQKYMLSIENLAWQNTEHTLKLPPCEIGPNGGRLMWFPPYDINFTDNSSVNWDSTVFIGRGEPIYTYNNTERTGTLAFKIVVDHSLAVAEIKEKGEQALFRYFAGCDDAVEEARTILPVSEIEEIKVEEKIKEESEGEVKQVIKEPTAAPNPPKPLPFFFRHAYYFEKDTVGTNLTTELTGPVSEVPPNYPSGTNIVWPNGYLRSAVPTVPPIINVDGEDAYNPAFSGDTQSGDTQAKLDSRNQMSLDRLDEIVELLLTPQGKRFKIKIIGTTSESGGESDNLALSKVRASSTEAYILKKLKEAEADKDPIRAENLGSEQTFPTETDWEGSDLRWDVIGIGEDDAKKFVEYDSTNNPNLNDENVPGFGPASALSPEAQKDRGSIVELVYNSEIDDLMQSKTQKPQQQYTENVENESETNGGKTKTQLAREETIAQKLAERGKQYMAWECSYFEKMKQDDPFIYETLQEKLKYFHPAFHSMTPEGFNSRLTFLKQCTRQGPNIAKGEPSNLAFGKPPICVLRVGDFYHTKIVIDTVNLTFDPLQWDLNPEGIGVQPMVCSVDLNFKFIGGSSLGGPISQLQNAVGFNFFANTGLYNPRTIYKSVKEYETTRPDPKTGEETEIKVKTSAENAGEPFGYGAYIVPGQAINNATGAIENEPVQTPQPTKSESTSSNQQAETLENAQLAEQEESLKKQIDEEFQKKVDERAGAFKIAVYFSQLDLKKPTKTTSVDLCQKNNYRNSIGYVKTSQESLVAIKVIWPNGTTKTYKRDKLKTKSYPNGLVGKQTGFKWVTIWDGAEIFYETPTETTKTGPSNLLSNVPKFGSETEVKQGIANGTYTITGIAEVTGNVAEDGTTETKEIESAPVTLKVQCCKKGSGVRSDDGQIDFIKEIGINGNCGE